MNQLKNKPFLLFVILSVFVTAILVFVPVNVFPGIIEQHYNSTVIKHEAPLNLGNFLGLHINPEDMTDIKTFYLLPTGYAMAFIMCLGIPALIAYRFHIKKLLPKKKQLLDN